MPPMGAGGVGRAPRAAEWWPMAAEGLPSAAERLQRAAEELPWGVAGPPRGCRGAAECLGASACVHGFQEHPTVLISITCLDYAPRPKIGILVIIAPSP